jgi:hypothetical protein
MYAGIGYTQRNGGLAAANVLSTANGTLSGAGCGAGGTCTVNTTISSWNPGVGLRYQF